MYFQMVQYLNTSHVKYQLANGVDQMSMKTLHDILGVKDLLHYVIAS